MVGFEATGRGQTFGWGFYASRDLLCAGEDSFANIAPATYKEGMSLPRKSKMKSSNQSTSGELGHPVSPAGAWVRLKTFY